EVRARREGEGNDILQGVPKFMSKTGRQAETSPPPWRSVCFGPGSDEMAGDAVRRRHRAQCNGLRADGLRKWEAAAQATATENVDGARHLAGEHDTCMTPIGAPYREAQVQPPPTTVPLPRPHIRF